MTDFMDALKGFASSLQPLAQQNTNYLNNQHMEQVFSANPAYGQALYGAKNDQQKTALAQYAQQLDAIKAKIALDPNSLDNQLKLAQIAKEKSEAQNNAVTIMGQTPVQAAPPPNSPNLAAYGTAGASSGGEPLSIRNNNPGNLRGSDGNFRQFPDASSGLAAMQSDLSAKINGQSPAMQANLGQGYAPTIRNIISTYAPKADGNNTDSYINTVAQNLGVHPDQPLAPQDAQKLAQAMIPVEGGPQAAQYYGQAQVGQQLHDPNAPMATAQLQPMQAPQQTQTVTSADMAPNQVVQPPQEPRFLQKKGTYITDNLPTGYALALDASGKQIAAPIPGVGSDSIITPQNAGLTGQAFMDTIDDKDVKNKAQAYIDGRSPLPPINSRTPSNVKKAVEAAQQADPNLNTSTSVIRTKTAESYAPAGKNGQILQAIGTASGHLADLQDAYDKLQNTGFKSANAIGNEIATSTDKYKPNVTAAIGKFRSALDAAGPELAKISSGNPVVGEGQINENKSKFDMNATPTEFHSAMTEAANLIKSRYESQLEGYQQAFDGTKLPPTTPKLSQRALNHFKNLGVDLNGGDTSSSPSPETGSPITKSIGGKTYVQQNGQWYEQ